jgi:hypothetical protein
MDMVEAFIFDVGWIFFAAWGMALAALSVIAFGRDILPSSQPGTVRKKRF